MADLDVSRRTLLHELAARFVWWKAPDDAVAYPQRVIAQVMNIGDFDDVQRLSRAFDDDVLREAIQQAEIEESMSRSSVRLRSGGSASLTPPRMAPSRLLRSLI
jgi:hypothetical protein